MVFIVMSFTQVAYASEFFENLDGMPGNIGNHNNYALDVEDSSFFRNPLGIVFFGLADLLFTIMLFIGKITISFVVFTLELNIFELLEAVLTPFFSGMRTIVFDTFAVVLISICGLFFMIRLVQRRQAQVITGLLQLVLILALAFAFYAFPMQIAGTVNQVVSELSAVVLQAPHAAAGNTVDAAAASEMAASLVWDVTVHRPWQLLNFGSIAVAEQHESSILTLAPNSGARQDLINELAGGALFSSASSEQLARIALAFIFLIFQLILSIIVAGICLLIIGYQFFVLFLLFIGAFVFLLALIPTFGLELLKRWALKILAASSVQLLLVFFLAIMFVIMDFIHGLGEALGLLPSLLIMISMIVIAVIKRQEILNLFANFKAENIRESGSRIMNSDFNSITALRTSKRKIEDYGKTYAGVTAKSDDELRRKFGFHPITPAGVSSGMYSAQYQGNFNIAQQVPQSQNVEQELRSLYAQTQVNTEHFKKAVEILERNYQLSKRQSEERAVRTGKEVEHSDFVKRTDAIRTLGAGDFDTRDISKTANIVRNVEASGGNPDELARAPKRIHETPLQRPEAIMRESSANSEALSQARGTSKEEQRNSGKRPERSGLDYFRHSFGEETGEQFYSELSKKYGEEKIKSFKGTEERMTYAQVHRKLKEAPSNDAMKLNIKPTQIRKTESEE